MTALPSHLDPGDEIEVSWERDDISTKVTASLGEASITVETTPEAANTVPWLISAMPSILEAAWSAIEGTPQEEA